MQSSPLSTLLKAVKSICTANLTVQRAPVKSHASQGRVERAVRLVESQYRAVLFDVQETTRVDIDPISAASAWILRHSAWLLNSHTKEEHNHSNVSQKVHTESSILLLFAMIECLVPSDRKPGGVLVVAKGAPRTFRSMWVGRTEESDDHLVAKEIGHVVRVRTVRRCVENENSGPDVVKLAATPSYLKPDGDGVEVQWRWTPTLGCRACESAHGNKHLIRCEARRYEYRLKYGRNPLVTTRGVYHELERAPEGAGPVASETNSVSDREREPVVSSLSTSSTSAPTETAHTRETSAFGRKTTRSESRKSRKHSRSQSTHGFVGYASMCTREHET